MLNLSCYLEITMQLVTIKCIYCLKKIRSGEWHESCKKEIDNYEHVYSPRKFKGFNYFNEDGRYRKLLIENIDKFDFGDPIQVNWRHGIEIIGVVRSTLVNHEQERLEFIIEIFDDSTPIPNKAGISLSIWYVTNIINDVVCAIIQQVSIVPSYRNDRNVLIPL